MNKKPMQKKAPAKPTGMGVGMKKGGMVKKPAKAPTKPMGYAKGGMVKGKC